VNCARAARLFGAYWDDEASQAEREWLESHLASCATCRIEYETLARTLELAASLPRVEPAPDLLERVVAHARRATTAPDRLPRTKLQWIPATAAAGVLLIVAMIVSPWVGLGPGMRMAERTSEPLVVKQPELVEVATREANERAPDRGLSDRESEAAESPLAVIPDSLFDHSEDVEFILDPVTMRRGRASMTRYPSGVQGEHAVITF